MASPSGQPTPVDPLQDALRLEKAGALDAAAPLLATAAADRPTDPAVAIAQARVAARRRDLPALLASLGRLVQIEPRQPAHRAELATVLFGTGDLAGAEREARAGLAIAARDGRLLNLLGVALKRQGRLAEAVEALTAATRAPGAGDAPWINLGNCHLELRQGPAAAEAFRKASRLKPKDAEPLRLLANAQALAGDPAAAEAAFRRAAQLAPRHPQIHADRAALLYNQRRYAEARTALETALRLAPGEVHYRINLARVLRHVGQPDEALAQFDQLLAEHPDHPDVLIAAGSYHLWVRDDRARANDLLGRALAAAPRHLEARGLLCWSLVNSRHGNEAEHIEAASRVAREAVTLGLPLLPIADHLQTVFLRTADFDSLAALGDVETLFAHWAAAGKVGALHNQLGRVRTAADRRALVHHHKAWGDAVIARARLQPLRPATRRVARPKVRVGLMSSDIRDHPVTYFVQPLIERYDRARFELYCYSFFPGAADHVQAHLAARVDQFRLMPAASDAQIAQQIADDDLDMLFELGGSTHLNRLEVMAWRAAPIQASWLGYPHSAGLTTIDYILTDPWIRPADPALLIERPFAMPESWVTLGSVGFHDVPIEPGLPDERAGHVTFGTMNNPYKYTPETIALWAAVLDRVPDSHFLFVRPEGGAAVFRANIARQFARHGIAPERIEFLPVRGKHLQHYNRIDVALDTAPHTGGTTTCETLWMGVPTVTLVGEAFFERLSYSNLNNAGLGELCTHAPDQYVDTAVGLAGDRARRLALRHGLRAQIRRNPLGQPDRWVMHFQQQVEAVLGAHR